MNDMLTEQKVNYYLSLVESESKLNKENATKKIQAYLTDYSCETLVIKVKEDFKKDWFKSNYNKLRSQYNETTLALETTYIANMYQGMFIPGCPFKTLFANSLGQLLRGETTIENIADYPIEWIVVAK